MVEQPQLKVSGYRGIWGESLTDEIAIRYARAFFEFLTHLTPDPSPSKVEGRKITILIGRDGRESGPSIKNAIIPELTKLGANVIDGDVLPTPTIMFAVNKHKYDGAIIITASHNPIEYNGLKFVTKEARLINEKEVKEIEREYINLLTPKEITTSVSTNNFLLKILSARLDSLRKASRSSNFFLRKNPNFPKEHADNILKHINVEAIRARKFKVAVDMVNASACVMDPYLFEQLGVELVPLNNVPTGKFTHRPEPVKENLDEIASFTKENNCDLGFAHDPDADRIIIINENGEVISEEYTLGFCVENVLAQNPGRAIAINMSTSQMTADIAKKYGSDCLRTKVGEPNVFAGIEAVNAIIGGEGTSGAIYPTINNCRDSFVSLSLILELLAKRKQTVSQCVDSLPKYFMKKDKWSTEGKNLEEIYQKLKENFQDAKANELDGLRLDLPDGSWLHLRPSNTEPIIRLFGEAKSEEEMEKLFTEAKNLLS